MQKMRILAKVVLIVLVVVLITHAVLMASMKKGLDRKLAELKARHEPLTYAELAPKPVPEDQNGASLYLDAYAVCFAATKPPSNYMVLGELLGTQKSSITKPEEIEPQAQEILAKCDTAIAYVKEAQKRHHCVFPIDWNKGFETQFPHTSKLRRISEILAAKAVIDAKDNNLDKVTEDVVLGIRMSDSVSSEPALISLLCRQSCIRKTLTGFRIVLEDHRLSEDQAHSIYDELAKIDLQPQYEIVMKGERIAGNDVFYKMRGCGDVPYWWVSMAASGDFCFPNFTMENTNIFEKGLASLASYAWRPVSYEDQRIYNDLIDKEISMISLPYRDLIKLPNIRGPKHAVTSNILLAPVSRITCSRDEVYANTGLAQAAAATMAYRDKFGSYPASLKDLKSHLGWKIPADPFSGKPFIYKREKSGFLVYSIGANLKDDGGKPQPPGKSSDSGNYDIAWKISK